MINIQYTAEHKTQICDWIELSTVAHSRALLIEFTEKLYAPNILACQRLLS